MLDYHNYDTFEGFATDVRKIFEILRYKSDKARLFVIANRDEGYRHLSDDTADFLEDIANIKSDRMKRRPEEICVKR